MSIYSFAITLTVLANLTYHVCQKSINSNVSPLVSLAATYAVALTATLVAIPFFSGPVGVLGSMRELNWASYGLGLGIFALEMGFLLAYRAGWSLSTAALVSNVCVAILLLPLGLIFFREKLSLQNWVGIALAILSIVLIGKR